MKRTTLLFLPLTILSLTVVMAQAQQGSIVMKVVDKSDNKELVGTVVHVTNKEDSEQFYYNSTKSDGSVSFPAMDYGEYELTATFMGYDTLRRNVVVDNRLIDLGTIELNFRSRVIDRVTVQTNSIRTSQSGDTVIYNADAFKVTADAVAEGLLAKLPGVTVDDGEVEVQGEAVQKVYLDGKEFFGEDVTIAVKNIPADIIDKVEVFNKLSDDAEFTGFDDGNGYKAINIVTKKGMNRGQFGKFVAGYASDDMYQVSANYNYFTADHRISVLASANNMNIKGFGSMDLGGGSRGGSGGRSMGSGAGSFSNASSSAGISTLSGFGLNYGGSFLEEKLKVEASYFYNNTETEVSKVTDREYITDSDELKRYYDAVSGSGSDHLNHRVNAKVEYKPNDRHSLMLRPEFVIQDSGSNSNSMAYNTQSSDGVTMNALNEIIRSSGSEKDAYSVSNTLVYRVLIGNKGRNIMFTARGSYSVNDNESLTYNTTSYPSADDEITNQNTFNDTESYSVNTSVTYSEPIFNKSAMLTMKYNANYRYSDADYLVYNEWDELDEIFNYNDYDEDRSNIYNSGYLTQSVGPGILYSKPNDIQLNASVSYQNATLSNSQEMPVIAPSDQEYSFDNFIYAMTMRKTFNQTNTLRVMLRSSTDNPSVSELQEVIKDSNPLSVSTGNSELEPSYSHSLRATYVRSSINKGRTFMAMLNASYTSNSIVDESVILLEADDTYTYTSLDGSTYDLEQYGEFTRPINMDGDWSVSTSFSYGTPVNLLYSNLNFDLGLNYSEKPSVLNTIENLNRTMRYSAGVSLGSNISEYVDFTLSYKGGYNVANYKYELDGANTIDNEYLTHRASAQFKFVFWGGITLSGSSSFSQYKGITDDFNEEYLLCNVYIGKKVFKNQRGEITFGVNDLFDQTESFSRNITETYIENVTSNSIGRYYGFKFTFDLRKFNGSTMPTRGSREDGDMGGEGRGQRGMGGGMSGGMGGPGGGMGGGMR